MKDKELQLVEKALKYNLHEQTEHLKITFDMMINNEEQDFYFGKDSYLNFIKKQIVKANDHIKAFKNLSKICNINLEEGIFTLNQQIKINVKRIEEHEKAIEKRSLFKIVNKKENVWQPINIKI